MRTRTRCRRVVTCRLRSWWTAPQMPTQGPRPAQSPPPWRTHQAVTKYGSIKHHQLKGSPRSHMDRLWWGLWDKVAMMCWQSNSHCYCLHANNEKHMCPVWCLSEDTMAVDPPSLTARTREQRSMIRTPPLISSTCCQPGPECVLNNAAPERLPAAVVGCQQR